MRPESDEAPEALPEKQLCLSCMAPNETAANFCESCGAPLSSYAATGPFEHLFAEGHLYRQAAERPKSLLVVLGVWIIFSSIAVGGAVLIFAAPTFSSVLFGVFALCISVPMIWKCTRNYLRRHSADAVATTEAP